MALMYAVQATGTLRVSHAGEIEGLDLHEHGTKAYPEFNVHGKDGTPTSLADVKAAISASKGMSPTIGD
jgi:Amt family ammonium transporter